MTGASFLFTRETASLANVKKDSAEVESLLTGLSSAISDRIRAILC